VDTQIEIRDQLARELAEAKAPPLGSLVTDALTRGRRHRRRRRFAVAGSGLVVMAVLVAAGVVFAGQPSGGGSGLVPGEAASPATTPPDRAGPDKAPPTTTPADPPVIPAGHKATTGAAVVALLLDLLPPGGGISEVEHFEEAGVASGGFLYDDGRGAATVSAGVADRPAGYGTEVRGLECPAADSDGFTCESRDLTGGLVARVMTMGPYGGDCSDTKCGIQNVRVELGRADGVYVTVDSYNGPFGRNRAATRESTLLDVEEMLAIARDPRWGLSMPASFVDSADRRY
jgi:hypothetical protein